jgi:transcriptional regulator with XRE-family HTH domain
MAAERLSSDPAFLAAYGEAVQERRAEIGLDRKELAERSGISYSYLSAIESGQKLPSGSYQSMLTLALELTPADLLARANGVIQERPDEEIFEARTVAAAPRAFRAMAAPSAPVARVSDVGDSGMDSGRTPRGVAAELEALMPRLSPEDQDMVLGMVRRLAGTEPPPRRRSWQEQSTRGSRGRESRTEAYLRFWTMYLAGLESRGLDWGQGRTPEPRSYFTTASPVRGSSFSASFARNRLLRHEMYINRGSREANVELLHDLKANRGIIESAYGAPLDFEDPGQERRAVRIAEYRDGHISRTDEFPEYVVWFIDRGERLRQALSAYERGSE